LIGGPLSLEGMRFDKLTVLIESDLGLGKNKEKRSWVCLCDCGKLCIRTTSDLRYKGVKSCGCFRVGYKEDLSGKRFGRYSVICCVGKRRKQYVWKCVCDCGKERYVTGNSLVTGQSLSCGCYRLDRIRELKLPAGESSFNNLYTSYKYRARVSRRKFDIPRDDFRRLTSQKCFYCGDVPKQKRKLKRTSIPYTYNGLDRIDNSKGYSLDNVVACCKPCNLMKKNMEQSDFLNHVEKIYKETIYMRRRS